MCFSADASFLAAAATGAAGVIALSRTTARTEWPLAAMPLFFAGQQAIEGLLWIAMPAGPSAETTLWTNLFLFFALVFWPIYAPLAVWLTEPDDPRRRWMSAFVTCGVIVSSYFAWSLYVTPQTASVIGGHIVYSGDQGPSIFRLLYPIATCGAAAVSSYRPVRLLALILIAGAVVSYFAYWHAFASVWCFFAAAASCVIVFQFEYARRQRRIARV